ncbi:hypothetical protein RFI_09291 [Reticulomyxa filosa]|uniref:Uncharacterized protein n=1 Tax=Reticulomyxa filosa TaxID=46433 RepID=X6NP95_RETFI|nr:hypothetical protein RFI_09291 [Reticulomyxa filosa]|eukprot:ETO27841.1 hypothetical protein RFI_09291 [Reticulomyxa filosa]
MFEKLKESKETNENDDTANNNNENVNANSNGNANVNGNDNASANGSGNKNVDNHSAVTADETTDDSEEDESGSSPESFPHDNWHKLQRLKRCFNSLMHATVTQMKTVTNMSDNNHAFDQTQGHLRAMAKKRVGVKH